jgi:creatinine amidohydrolase/Fe(II)-dependent formamide hydrolase-like protein
MSGSGDRSESWRCGLRLLTERLGAAPAVLAGAFDSLPSAADAATGGVTDVERVVATGAGSSAAHARFFVSAIGELGVAARFAPLSSFLEGVGGEAERAALVVFSQGLSPNARIALARAEVWRLACLVTSTPDEPDDARPVSDRAPAVAPASSATDELAPASQAARAERRAALAALRERGVRVLRHPGAEEYGTLLRVVGPLTGYAAALALARALARSLAPSSGGLPEPSWTSTPASAICASVAAARERALAGARDLDASAFEADLAFLTSGRHLERVGNLPLKVLEGMLRPLPPVWDLLDFAHGPYQQTYQRPATLIALSRADAVGEEDLLARVEAMLVPERHRLLRLRAALPGPLAVFEHDAMMSALVLRYVGERGIDQLAWPGKGRDGPLYEVGGAAPPPPTALRLEELSWPEVAGVVAGGQAVALLPLGSTEQHGPHLPLATDTVIARALAERLATRISDAVVLPALGLGCAEEHLAFAGTLSLRPETLEAILCDLAASLECHGFARLFVLTAHGGNRPALARALGAMRARATRLAIACPESLPPASVLHAASARFGVPPEGSGHHAGELETSLVARLEPSAVRWDRLAPGLLDVGPDPSAVFYPSLRAKSESGTVGDPRGADPARAEDYLATWVDWLVDVYGRDESWK